MSLTHLDKNNDSNVLSLLMFFYQNKTNKPTKPPIEIWAFSFENRQLAFNSEYFTWLIVVL